jgi:dihydrofolate synthase/folylpolyglutamate synthase
MKSLPDWLEFLERLHPKGQAGIDLGLARVTRVQAELRQRQTCPLVVVGGTNGKGSTCAYLEAVWRAAGYRVGCYTSPHLLTYGERVRVDGAPAGDASLCAAFARVEAARRAAGDVALTYFEFGTLAAWELFAQAGAEAVILEVGLGGRLDAVNAYDADVAVVTGIAIDHTDWLGPDRETIGFEKAGIFRRGRPAICADAHPPQSLLAHARAIGAELSLIGRDFGHERGPAGWSYWNRHGARREALPVPALTGGHQFGNASAALAALDALQDCLPVPLPAIRHGLNDVRLAGRFQRVSERPAVILDVAHNPQAVACLADNLAAMGAFRRTLAVVGMLADKDISGTLRMLAGRIDGWLLCGLDVPRGATAQTLAAVVKAERLGGWVECFSSPAEAFGRAMGLAEEDDRIIVFGSFHTVAAVLREIGQGRRDDPGPWFSRFIPHFTPMSDSVAANLQLKKRARRRLIGAIAFAGLVAVVLPMIMDEEPKQQVQDVDVRIPGQDDAPFAPKLEPAGDGAEHAPPAEATFSPVEVGECPPEKPAVEPEAEKPTVKPAEKPAPKPEAAKSAARPAEKPLVKPAEKPATKPAGKQTEAQRAAAILSGKVDDAAPAAGNVPYVILIGAFAKSANVKILQTKIGELGIKVYTEPLESPEGMKTRVRAGPFPDRAAAERALEKMKRIGVNGVVAAKQ